MKKTGLLVLALLMVGTATFCIDLSVGAKAAGGYAGFLGKDYSDYLDSYNSKRALFIGYGGGVFATIGLIDILAVQPEVLVLGIGGADKDTADDTYLFRSHHIAPAVLIKVRFGMINLLAGPMVVFKIGSGKEGWKYSDGTKNIVDMADDDVSSMLFAATAGGGINYPLPIGSIVAELRGFYSFTSYWNQDKYPDVWNPFGIMVMIGFSYQVLQ